MTVLLYLIIPIGIFLLYGAIIYNSLIKNRNLVEEAWSVIDVMLKKRYDLIPNLVETVKVYATHEKETLQNVVQARNQAINANDVENKQFAEQTLNHSLKNLFALSENYPDLKANANFLQLQADLSAIESDLEKSRRYYNGTVREFNIKIEIFPNNIIANIYGFTKAKFFEIQNVEEKSTPQVKF
nr:LemA family protein [uncultured Flavobacterium sp.]